MNCKISGEYMMKYFDGELSDDEYNSLRQHMEKCRKCKETFEDLSDITAVLAEDGKNVPLDGFEAKVMEKIEAVHSIHSIYSVHPVHQTCKTDIKSLIIIYTIASSIIFLLSLSIFLEFRGLNIMGIIQRVYLFSVFASGIMMAVSDTCIATLELLYGTLRIFLHTALALLKNYYYITAIILLMVLTIQKLVSLNRQEGGYQK